MNNEPQTSFLYKLSLWSAIIVVIIVAAVSAAQAYVRWNLNQDFTFLGGFELEALTLCAAAILVTLLLVNRPRA